jgi:hypothetical protein
MDESYWDVPKHKGSMYVLDMIRKKLGEQERINLVSYM